MHGWLGNGQILQTLNGGISGGGFSHLYAHHALGFVNPAIYRIARGSSYRKAFHDITTGNNKQTMPYPVGTAGYRAGSGWDPVTGWGTPNTQVLIPLL